MKRLLLVLALLLIPLPRAHADTVLSGFAVGTFDNGYVYHVAQSFTVDREVVWTGFGVYVGEATGNPQGEVAWSLLSQGEELAQDTFLPEPLYTNSVETAPLRLLPGEYMLTFQPEQEQEVGNYWNFLASTEGVYTEGTLWQYQVGGEWEAWDNHDLVVSLYFTRGDIIISPFATTVEYYIPTKRVVL